MPDTMVTSQPRKKVSSQVELSVRTEMFKLITFEDKARPSLAVLSVLNCPSRNHPKERLSGRQDNKTFQDKNRQERTSKDKAKQDNTR